MTKADHDFRPGDLIRLVSNPCSTMKGNNIGDVHTVVPQTCCASASVCFEVNGDVMWRPAEYFELIARAGEPVTYLPGDVVECIHNDDPVGHAGLPGKRYTVAKTQSAKPVGRFGTPLDLVNDGTEPAALFSVCSPSRFKLVHRPVVKATEPLTLTPPEPQVGDRVRVTFEGEVAKVFAEEAGNAPGDRGLRIRPGEQLGDWLFTDGTVRREDFKIEVLARAEPPLAVGDRVTSYRYHPQHGTLVHVQGKFGTVEVNPDRIYCTLLSNLERVS